MPQDDYIKMQLRLPPDLHAEIRQSAERHERSLNGELTYRLRIAMSLERRRVEHGEAEYWYSILRGVIVESGDEYK